MNRALVLSSTLSAFLAISLACDRAPPGSGSTPAADGGRDPEPVTPLLPIATECPASALLSVCDLKMPGGARQPPIDTEVRIQDVVVTANAFVISSDEATGAPTLMGLFVQDPSVVTSQFAGIQVVFGPRDLGRVPVEGDKISLRGQYKLFGREGRTPQPQIRALEVEVTGRGTVVALPFADAAQLAAGETAVAYEGSLVEVQNVTATSLVVPSQSGTGDLFNAFAVEGTLVVSTELARYQPQASEGFERITGILRLGTNTFNAGLFLLTPRNASDIVSKTPRVVLTSIAEIRAKKDHCVENAPQATCTAARITDVIVTAVGGYDGSNHRALWVQDPTIADAENAGIKVVYRKDYTGFLPAVGDGVIIEGRVQRYYGSLQILTSVLKENSATAEIVPTLVRTASIAWDWPAGTNPYEGVLVRLEEAEVTEACVPGTDGKDHGNWLLDGKVLVGTAFRYGYNGVPDCAEKACTCEEPSRTGDSRRTGDTFESVTGVMNYSFDALRLEPRALFDLVD